MSVQSASEIGRTYFIDVDGTLVPHLSNVELDGIIESENYNFDSKRETLLPGVKELWATFKEQDTIIITTARRESHREMTENIFRNNGLRYDKLIMDLPSGPRIVINDTTDSLYQKAIGINVMRNSGFRVDPHCITEIP